MAEDSTGREEDSTGRAVRSPGVQARETCQMCQGTGRTAFVLPNLLREELPVRTAMAESGRGNETGEWNADFRDDTHRRGFWRERGESYDR
jgi:hypothetical protein